MKLFDNSVETCTYESAFACFLTAYELVNETPLFENGPTVDDFNFVMDYDKTADYYLFTDRALQHPPCHVYDSHIDIHHGEDSVSLPCSCHLPCQH